MNPQEERRKYFQSLIEDQEKSGLSRREFCQRHQIVLSQFSYYYTMLKKKNQREFPRSDIVPVHIRQKTLDFPMEIKVSLENGLHIFLTCADTSQLRQWMGVLKSC